MPSDTVWVGLIGGGVTVSSLWVQGWLNRGAEKRRNKREDDQRKEDRDWAIKQQNIEQRRELYGTLLRHAENLDDGLDHLAWIKTDIQDEEWFERTKDELDKSAEKLDSTAATVQVQSPDEEVMRLARRAAQLAQIALTQITMDDVTQGKKRQRDLHDLIPSLRAACRRDLGFADNASADRH